MLALGEGEVRISGESCRHFPPPELILFNQSGGRMVERKTEKFAEAMPFALQIVEPSIGFDGECFCRRIQSGWAEASGVGSWESGIIAPNHLSNWNARRLGLQRSLVPAAFSDNRVPGF